MKCSVCGKEIKGKFYKVYPTQENEYYTNNNTLFICHNCVKVRTVNVFKVKQGYKLQDLEFMEYKDCDTYTNPYVYELSLKDRIKEINLKLKELKGTWSLSQRYLLEQELKELLYELNQLKNESIE